MTTLCIVDLQQDFFVPKGKKAKAVLNEVLNQIRLAKRRKAGIVVVEYKDCGETNPKIIEAIGSYNKSILVEKAETDGSEEVVGALKRHKFGMERIRVCGAFTSCCVYDTAIGLSEALPKATISLVENACYDHWCGQPSKLFKNNNYDAMKLQIHYT